MKNYIASAGSTWTFELIDVTCVQVVWFRFKTYRTCSGADKLNQVVTHTVAIIQSNHTAGINELMPRAFGFGILLLILRFASDLLGYSASSKE